MCPKRAPDNIASVAILCEFVPWTFAYIAKFSFFSLAMDCMYQSVFLIVIYITSLTKSKNWIIL